MTSDDLKVIVAFFVALILFAGIVVIGLSVGSAHKTDQMKFCVEAGGSYDSSRGDCILPDVPLED